MNANAPERDHKTALRERVNESEMLVVTPGEKQNGDVSGQYQNREDLEKAFNETKRSEARLRKILDVHLQASAGEILGGRFEPVRFLRRPS